MKNMENILLTTPPNKALQATPKRGAAELQRWAS